MPAEIGQHFGFPVTSVANEAQIGERPFGRSDFAFDPRQQVAKIDQQAAVALIHVLRQNEYTREIVVHERLFLLGKVADHLKRAGRFIVLGQHVEQKRLHVKVERLVVEKQLGE